MFVFSAHVKTPGFVVPLIDLGKWKLFDGLPIMNDLFEVRNNIYNLRNFQSLYSAKKL